MIYHRSRQKTERQKKYSARQWATTTWVSSMSILQVLNLYVWCYSFTCCLSCLHFVFVCSFFFKKKNTPTSKSLLPSPHTEQFAISNTTIAQLAKGFLKQGCPQQSSGIGKYSSFRNNLFGARFHITGSMNSTQ